MPYATLQDLIERAGEAEILQTADRDDDGIPDAGVVAAAIDAAEVSVNGYLGTRFALPLSTVPTIVRKWTVSIARYHLHRNGPPDYVVRDHTLAVSELKDAAAGRLTLPDLAGVSPQASTAGTIAVTGPEPAFDRAGLEGWL